MKRHFILDKPVFVFVNIVISVNVVQSGALNSFYV